MTLKAPLILNQTLSFLLEIDCLVGVERLSRKYAIDDDVIEKMIAIS